MKNIIALFLIGWPIAFFIKELMEDPGFRDMFLAMSFGLITAFSVLFGIYLLAN